MTKLMAFALVLVSASTFAAEPTVKLIAHSTYLCGDNGLVVKTSGLSAKIGDEDGYKMLSSDNKPDTEESPAYLAIQYTKSAPSDSYSNWFSLTLTTHSEFIALTYVNKAKGIELIGMSCQIVE
ncbi:hypothetical protein [Lelliottia nimipressuralis]|uniref:Secreted protein n=1 Tax=Lelliottia nimipressuralis TaxID=69220 RepID=A0ABD4KIZ1_9ENTR|nr:hypothetical protein [Lelliottia nimipressuralis]MBF4180534.1 hypothetical protein [Lelliottia nimipressuralis]